MSKLFFAGLLCGVLCMHAGTFGLVVPGLHPNYTVQLPPDQSNSTGISLEDLLEQNPQNLFAFTSQTDSGPRNLIGYFDPVLPALQGIWTTPYVIWVASEEPEPIIIPPPPPPPPPPGCEVTGTCPPPPPPPGCEVLGICPPPPCVHDCHPPPPGCEVTGTCPPPPGCEVTGTCPPPPPPTEVPEPQMWVLMVAGMLLICACRPRPRAH